MYQFFLGHYMYIETSSPRVQGDNAMLLSSQHIASQSDVCLSFYFHMFGIGIGMLSVRVSFTACYVYVEACIYRCGCLCIHIQMGVYVYVCLRLWMLCLLDH